MQSQIPADGIDGVHRDGVVATVNDVGKAARRIDGYFRWPVAGNRGSRIIRRQDSGGGVERVLVDAIRKGGEVQVIDHVGPLAVGGDEDLKRAAPGVNSGG